MDPFVARVFKSTSFSPQESLTAVAALVGVVDLNVAFDKLDEEAQALIEDAGNMKMYQEAQKAVLDGFKSIKQPADAKSLAKNDAFVAICKCLCLWLWLGIVCLCLCLCASSVF